jgi:hypothetical protein
MTCMTKNTLHLISHQSWQVQELSSATGWTVDHSFGLDVPSYDKNDAWWMPQAQAVQLLRAIRHYDLPPVRFTAPTPDLLDTLPFSFTGRKVETLTADDALSTLIEWPDLWWKLATAKHEGFIAQERTHDEMVDAVYAADLPDETLLQHSTALPEIISEYRYFITSFNGIHTIAAHSGYLRNGVTVYDGAVFVEEEEAQATNVIHKLLDEDSGIKLPPSFVVDIAVTVEGAFVLEFNPSWCSGWYNADVTGVMETIQRGFQASKAEMRAWKYVPDPALTKIYANPARRLWAKPQT